MTHAPIHPASHCPLLVISRADGRSAVAAAAYAARTSMTDDRTGRRYNYRSAVGLISEGLIGWDGSAEELWNAAEKSEVRGNARVARELRPALPSELPLDEQHRLVKGFSCWLREEFGVAVHHVIHAPTLYNAVEGKRLWRDRLSREGMQELQDALFDPAMSNLNFHAHIRFTTRIVDRNASTFGAKTRVLDDRKTGPEMLHKIRSEWQRRTNQALARNGSSSRIDLRSYATMATDGDAPDGLEQQQHLGPRTTEKARTAAHDATARTPLASIERAEVRERNEERWNCWLAIRTLEREKARLSGLTEIIAAERETARKAAADVEKLTINKAQTDKALNQAIANAASIDLTTPLADGYRAAIEWARRSETEGLEVQSLRASEATECTSQLNTENGQGPGGNSADEIDGREFDREIDPETYVNPDTAEAPREKFRIRRISRVRVRGKAG